MGEWPSWQGIWFSARKSRVRSPFPLPNAGVLELVDIIGRDPVAKHKVAWRFESARPHHCFTMSSYT